MLHVTTGSTGARVNPLVPMAAVLAGALAAAAGRLDIGIGIASGGLLAYVNGLLLSRRVDLAADTGNAAAALLVMQLGLLISLTLMAIATIVLARYSVSTAVAEAAGFGGAHLAILAVFYWTHARRMAAREPET
jgi:hypothetical protein